MDAGWYNDPFGRFAQRYHDGDDWSEHVSYGDGRSFPDPSGKDPFVSGAAPAGYANWAPPTATDAKGRSLDLGGPWPRIAGAILDAIIVGVPLGILLLLSVDWAALADSLETGDQTEVFSAGPWLYLVSFGVNAAYQIVMVGQWGRTVGQMATGLRVAQAGDRSAPGYGVATIRYLGSLLYAIPFFGLGIIVTIVSVVMLFADGQRQTIPDKVAKTVVVTAR